MNRKHIHISTLEYENTLEEAKKYVAALHEEVQNLVAIKRLYDGGLTYQQAEYAVRGFTTQPQVRLIKKERSEEV
jgi:hypothetical protein